MTALLKLYFTVLIAFLLIILLTFYKWCFLWFCHVFVSLITYSISIHEEPQVLPGRLEIEGKMQPLLHWWKQQSKMIPGATAAVKLGRSHYMSPSILWRRSGGPWDPCSVYIAVAKVGPFIHPYSNQLDYGNTILPTDMSKHAWVGGSWWSLTSALAVPGLSEPTWYSLLVGRDQRPLISFVQLPDNGGWLKGRPWGSACHWQDAVFWMPLKSLGLCPLIDFTHNSNYQLRASIPLLNHPD